MSLVNTICNWRWWVALPVAFMVLPVILVDLIIARALGPAWNWLYEVIGKAYKRVLRWVQNGVKETRP